MSSGHEMGDGSAPSIAVVIPTFDRAHLVTDLVEELLDRQTMRSFDLVVVDDGSTDDTVARLSAIADPRLSVAVQEHSGVSAARNFGARSSSANWLVFLDSDDTPDPDWLSTIVALTDDHSDGDEPDVVSIGQRRSHRGHGRVRRPSDQGSVFGGLPILWQAGAFAIRRQLFEEIGGYTSGLAYSENTELALRVADRHEHAPVHCRVDDEPHYTVRVRNGRYDAVRSLEAATLILDSHIDRLRRDPGLLSDYHAIAGVASRRLGHRRRATGHLLSAVKHAPNRPRNYARLAQAVFSPATATGGQR